MSNQTLRQLAKDYARGAINKDKYRKSRGELIKGIIDGNVAVKSIDYDPPLEPPTANEEDITEKAKRDNTLKTEIKPEQAPVKERTPVKPQQPVTPVKEDKKFPWLFISLSSLVVIILIVTVIMFYPKPPVASKTTTTTSTTSSEKTSTSDNDKQTITQATAGETLIAEFLTAKNWSEESIDDLINSWQNLTQEERDSAAETNRMRRMNDSIYKQFLEEKALAGIDSEKAIIKQEKLIELAESLDIQDSRLVVE